MSKIVRYGVDYAGNSKNKNNTILVPVEAAGFTLNAETNRYEQTIAVDEMTAGDGGIYDVLRSGPVLTEEESEFMFNITDVDRLNGAIKISCLKPPTSTHTLVLYETYAQEDGGSTLLSSMPQWFNRVETLENNVTTLNSNMIHEFMTITTDNNGWYDFVQKGKIPEGYVIANVFVVDYNDYAYIGGQKGCFKNAAPAGTTNHDKPATNKTLNVSVTFVKLNI